MGWCRQATGLYLRQCWPWSMASLGHNELTQKSRVSVNIHVLLTTWVGFPLLVVWKCSLVGCSTWLAFLWKLRIFTHFCMHYLWWKWCKQDYPNVQDGLFLRMNLKKKTQFGNDDTLTWLTFQGHESRAEKNTFLPPYFLIGLWRMSGLASFN